MKELTSQEVCRRFEEVIKSKDAYFMYNETKNLIYLDGNFCSDELREIARVMDEVFKETH